LDFKIVYCLSPALSIDLTDRKIDDDPPGEPHLPIRPKNSLSTIPGYDYP
jgi:hypothetical protein